MLLRPSFNDKSITRYEAGLREKQNVRDNVYMPFEWKVVTTTLLPKQPDGAAPANILAYGINSHKIASHYSFRLVIDIPAIQSKQLDSIVEEFGIGANNSYTTSEFGEVSSAKRPVDDVISPDQAQVTSTELLEVNMRTVNPITREKVYYTEANPQIHYDMKADGRRKGLVEQDAERKKEAGVHHDYACLHETKISTRISSDGLGTRGDCNNEQSDKLIAAQYNHRRRKRDTEYVERNTLVCTRFDACNTTAKEHTSDDMLQCEQTNPFVFNLATVLLTDCMWSNDTAINAIATTIATDTNQGRNHISMPKTNEPIQRPPKPKVPKPRECHSDERWNSAYIREMNILKDSNAQDTLQKDTVTGRYNFPAGCVVFRINVVHEFKWKVDPEDGQWKWLECARFTADASKDARPFKREELYAETPDGSLVLFFLNLCASLKLYTEESDAIRAYLQAPSIDTPTVVVYPEFIVKLGMPKCAVLNVGLYGTVMAALGYEKFSDSIFRKNNWSKLDVGRGLYIIIDSPGVVGAMCLRHSDNYTWASSSRDRLVSEVEKIGKDIKMTPLKPLGAFLGMEIQRVNAIDGGSADLNGDVMLARQTEYITAMGLKHQHLHIKYNPKEKTRKIAAPCDPERELTPEEIEPLNEAEAKEYMGITGDIVWITGRTRPSIRYESRELSSRNMSPRWIDMYRAVWLMDYLMYTKEMPLALGGNISDPHAIADCSLGTGEEHRSIIGGYGALAEMSGAIVTFVTVLKCAITQIMEGEVFAAVAAADLTIYLDNLCAETAVVIPPTRRVYCDNKSGIDWIHGAVAMKGTKHYARKLYRGRHLQDAQIIDVIYIKTKDNGADKLTKKTFGRDHQYKTGLIQGHGLVQGMLIPGVVNTTPPVVVPRQKEQQQQSSAAASAKMEEEH